MKNLAALDQREILAAAAQIKRATNRDRRIKLKAERLAVAKALETGVRGRVHDRAYLAWLRRQPCVLTLVGGCTGPTQAAHLRYGDAANGRVNPGLQVKPSDQWATPLCAGHHAEQHAAGNERRWWASHGLDGSEVALAHYAEFSALSEQPQQQAHQPTGARAEGGANK